MIGNNLSASDWLSIAGICVDVIAIIVGAFIAVWVVKEIQARIDNEGKLKDYFATCLVQVKEGYREVLNDIYLGKAKPTDLKSRLNLLSIQSTSIMNSLSYKYCIDKNALGEYQTSLFMMVADCDEYVENAFSDSPIKFSETTMQKIRTFDVSKNAVFDDLLVKLYTIR